MYCICCNRLRLTKRGDRCAECAKPKHIRKQLGNSICPLAGQVDVPKCCSSSSWSPFLGTVLKNGEVLKALLNGCTKIVVAGSGSGWTLPVWRALVSPQCEVFGVDVLYQPYTVEPPKFNTWQETFEYLNEQKTEHVAVVFEWPNCRYHGAWPLEVYEQLKKQVSMRPIVMTVTGTEAWLPRDLYQKLKHEMDLTVQLNGKRTKTYACGPNMRFTGRMRQYFQFRVWVPKTDPAP